MRIVCPICSAAYEVRDALLVPGRAVRCARCGEQWVAVEAALAVPPQPADEPPDLITLPQQSADTPPSVTAMDRLASHPAPLPRASPLLRAAWAASLVVLLLCCWGIIAWRADVMHTWPASTRLYDAIGLAPAPPGH